MRRLQLLLLAPLLLACGIALAVPAQINVAEVPIATRSQQAIQQAIPKAFSQVLVKMTGNSGAATLPALQNLSEQAEKLVLSYSYRTVPSSDNGAPQQFLRVVFDKHALVRQLNAAGQPVWSGHRPTVLMWIQIQDADGTNSVLSNDMNGALLADLKHSAFRRGLPYLLPEMDLQDQQVATNQKTLTAEMLQSIGARYQVSDVLAGTLELRPDQQWQGSWIFLFNGTSFEWRNSGATPDAVMASAIDNTTDMMANRYAVNKASNAGTPITMTISGVTDLDEYAKVLAYLRNLSPVVSAQVSDTSNTQLTVQVNVVGGQTALQQALANSEKLVAINADQFSYVWRS